MKLPNGALIEAYLKQAEDVKKDMKKENASQEKKFNTTLRGVQRLYKNTSHIKQN
jgi:hypothetical protein